MMKTVLMIVFIAVATLATAATITLTVDDDILLLWASSNRNPITASNDATIEDAQALFQKFCELELLRVVNTMREYEVMSIVREQITPITKVDEKIAPAEITAVSVSLDVKPTK